VPNENPPATSPEIVAVCVFHGPDRRLVGLYATKAEADQVAAKVKGGFVLPPKSAWAGKQEAHA